MKKLWVMAMIGIVAVLVCVSWWQSSVCKAGERRVTVLYTHAIQSYLEPCG